MNSEGETEEGEKIRDGIGTYEDFGCVGHEEKGK